MGPPCQTTKAWHACEPAMTIIPSYLISGAVAILVSIIVIIWAAAFVQRKHGGLILIVLSILQLIVGGGFIPVVYGIIAGIAGTRIHKPLTWWRNHLPVHTRSFLAALWPWSLVAFMLWSSAEWILGYYFNELLLNLTLLTMLISLGLVLLTVLTAYAHDIQRQTASLQVISMSG
jgi:MFS family permease